MKIYEKDSKLFMQDFDSFDISQILECGQCFRFEKLGDMDYSLTAYNKRITVTQKNDTVIFGNMSENEFNNIWKNYFDLNTDYSQIKKKITTDETIEKAISFASGIRLLNQEPFECLISFIISQNNRIPQIKKVIENISQRYGKDGFFPTREQLSCADLEGLRECKTGFRNKYIIDAVEKTDSSALERLKDMTAEEAKKELLKIKGVGEKVADCVLLFSLGKRDMFPVDVWVKRIMEYFYFDKQDTSVEKIHSFAYEKWGELAGFAQQYLFYYARTSQFDVKEVNEE
jgi:N-glycosylase/DNA lyase